MSIFTEKLDDAGAWAVAFAIFTSLALALATLGSVAFVGIKKLNKWTSNLDELTTLETEYQVIKLKQNPNWREPLADIALSRGMAVVEAKREANERARARLFGAPPEQPEAEHLDDDRGRLLGTYPSE